MEAGTAPAVVVMGVRGCGESTLGAMLADLLGVPFIAGEDLYSECNRSLTGSFLDESRIRAHHQD